MTPFSTQAISRWLSAPGLRGWRIGAKCLPFATLLPSSCDPPQRKGRRCLAVSVARRSIVQCASMIWASRDLSGDSSAVGVRQVVKDRKRNERLDRQSLVRSLLVEDLPGEAIKPQREAPVDVKTSVGTRSGRMILVRSTITHALTTTGDGQS